MKYICDVCGYEYDEAAGDPDNGIAPAPSGRMCRKILSARCAGSARISFRRNEHGEKGVQLLRRDLWGYRDGGGSRGVHV